MDLQCKLLLYLDKRRHLASMKDACEIFCARHLDDQAINKFPPLRFVLEIDAMDILDAFPDVGELLLKEPLKWQQICNNLLFACFLSTKGDTITHILPAQLAVIIRIKSLSRLLVPPNTRYYSGLVTFEGMLISVSKPENCAYHTVWSCPEECEGTEVILHYIPKVPPKCYVCKSILFENCGLRRCGERVKAMFKLATSNSGKELNIDDDLIPRLILGSKYLIHAVVTKNATVVISLEEILPLAAPITTSVPKDIEQLYEGCNAVPWKFIYCLSSSFGVNVCPLNCFMHLKISLLISLSSIKANTYTGSSIVHVLVAGFDTRYVREIMADAAKIADSSISLGSTSNVTASSALLATSGGVCIMPLPFHIYNKKISSYILAAIENGEMIIETSRVKLQTAIWAQGRDFKKVIVVNVASIFGTVCRGDLGDYSDEIADFVLQHVLEPSEKNDDEVRALRDVKLYIDLVAGIEVALDYSAEVLIRSYFLSARKERPSGVSVASMNALVTICMTSARLCRRNVANVEDAVLAIWLHVSGGPEPRFAPNEYLQTPSDIKKLNVMMDKFKIWLGQFTGTCVS